MSVRIPAVAGSFYPASPTELSMQVDHLLQTVPFNKPAVAPRMLIVPHAGYIYSGEYAACAYARLRAFSNHWHRVLLLGPSHRVAFRGMAYPLDRSFSTPLGDIPIDPDVPDQLTDMPWVLSNDQPHRYEHCLEVQLPFLQRVLGDFTLVPFVVGEASADQVSEVIGQLYDNRTLLVVSTDLSHFLTDADARRVDADTRRKILSFQDDLRGDEACGHMPLNGALKFARSQGWHIEDIGHGNSGRISHDMDRVVGYGAFALTAEVAA